MGGALDARDGALREAQVQLDAFAFELAGALNTAHQAGVGLDGGSGRPLFSVTAGAPGAARALAVDPALAADPQLLATATSAAGLPGDGGGALALLATESATLPSGSSPTGALSLLVSGFGASASSATARADYDQGLQEHLGGLREAASGVSVDEELINLTRAQRAFEAVSKVIQTADSMLDTLMKLK
jgi:flagellar hook-associated protein 1 FlgK